MTLRSSDLQSDSDLDNIRNPCDVFFKTCHALPPTILQFSNQSLAAKNAGFESSQMDWEKTECKQMGNCLLSSLLSPKNLSVYLFMNGRKRNFLLFLTNQTSWQMEKRFFCTNHSLPRKNQHTSTALTGCQSPSESPYLKTRREICQNIYTTKFSCVRILHIENA